MMKIKQLIVVVILLVMAVPAFAEKRYGTLWETTISVSYGDDSNLLTIGGDITATDGFENRWETRAMLAGALMAYFYRPEWRVEDTSYFWSDIRDLKLPKEWVFHVQTGYRGSIAMRWDMTEVPDTVELYLTDEYSGGTIDMRTQGSYYFTPASAAARAFKITALGSIGIQDTTPPDTIISTVPGLINSASLTLKYTGSDETTPAERLEYSYNVDGGMWSVWDSAVTTVLSNLSDGIHTFSVRAKDEAGNIDPTPAEVSFTVDTTPPIVTLNEPVPAVLWPPTKRLWDVKVSGSASDSTSGVSDILYSVSDEYGEFSYAGNVSLVNGGFSFTVSLRAWRNGDDADGRTYTIIVTAVDKAGNKNSVTVTVKVPHSRK